jgi:citrate synthase
MNQHPTTASAHDDWVPAAEAARRLDVKVGTLYSYVSRGLLRSRRDESSRRSVFNAAEVDDLRRTRARHTRDQQLTFESTVTVLSDDRPFYRGLDAVQLADSHTYEQVAEHLWLTGTGPAQTPWRTRPGISLTAARDVQDRLPCDVTLIDRIEVIVTLLAASDPLRSNTDPISLPFTARSMIAAIVGALPLATGPPSPAATAREASLDERRPVADRLWWRLSPTAPRSQDLSLLNSAMVLLADHELAASTVAARVAASVQADPYSVVTAGLGVLRGPRHGGDVRRAEELLRSIVEVGSADRVIGALLQRSQSIPGVGHLAYVGTDARSETLLGKLREAYPTDPFVAAADAVRRHIEHSRLPATNIDLALAALTGSAGMVAGAGEAIFAISRIAGWLAHAMEEYRSPTRLRPRAIYPQHQTVGPRG